MLGDAWKIAMLDRAVIRCAASMMFGFVSVNDYAIESA